MCLLTSYMSSLEKKVYLVSSAHFLIELLFFGCLGFFFFFEIEF